MSIFTIKEDLLSIFEEIEDNCGELTPELQEKLTIAEDELKDKVEDYVNVIKSIDVDLKAIKEEQQRLKQLYEHKEKVQNKLKDIVIDAITQFGNVKKSGVSYIDYGTGEVSVRITQVLKVNEDLIKYVGDSLQRMITYNKEINQLDVYDRIDDSSIITDIAQNTDIGVSKADIDNINIDLAITIPMKDLSNGDGYNIIKEVAKYSNFYKLSPSVSKSIIKKDLQENGSCMPNLAKLDENKSLNIK